MCVVLTQVWGCVWISGSFTVTGAVSESVNAYVCDRVCYRDSGLLCVWVNLSDEKAKGKPKTTEPDYETRGERRSDRTSETDRSFSFTLTNDPRLLFHLLAKTFLLLSHSVITHTYLQKKQMKTNCSSFHSVAEQEMKEILLSLEATGMLTMPGGHNNLESDQWQR